MKRAFDLFQDQINSLIVAAYKVVSVYGGKSGSLLDLRESLRNIERLVEYTDVARLELSEPPLPPAVKSDLPTVSVATDNVQPDLNLSKDQQVALDKLQKWLTSDHQWFILKGFAGTGKTYLLRKFADNPKIYFSAPTNKAAKVLSKSIGRAVGTTYSFLGLRMKEVEDRMVLEASEQTPYIPRGSILVIDEASMCGSDLINFIKKFAKEKGLRVIFVGDPMQLPPVGESISPCWKVTLEPECRAYMKEIRRHDNAILQFSTEVRKRILEKNWSSPSEDIEFGEGVQLLSKKDFVSSLSKLTLEDTAQTKVIAWRNKTVNKYNNLIRSSLGFEGDYCVGDRLLLAEPIEVNNCIVAHVDEEFQVTETREGKVNIDGIQIPIYSVAVSGDSQRFLQIPRGDTYDRYMSSLAEKARAAEGSARRVKWKEFWEAKKRFNKVRYGYALTAHRAQGSTYENIYVDQLDILANSTKKEAFKCLYVAATRPSKNLILY